MTQPVAARADAFAVDRLLEAVAGLEKTRTLEDVDAKEVGLDKPRATLRLATKDGAKVLKLGAEVPPGGSLVAGLEGEKGAYVVSDTILAELEREPSEWRDKQMFRADREAVRRITLTACAAEGPVALVKRPAGFWIERPIADRADRDLVDGLLSDLTGLTAERFLEGSRPLAEWNLAPPRETVQVDRGAAPVRVELGSAVTGEEAPEGEASGELATCRWGTPCSRSARVWPSPSGARRRIGGRCSSPWPCTTSSRPPCGTSGPLSISPVPARTGSAGDTLISYLPVSDLLFALTGARADRLLTPQEAPGLAKPVLIFTLRSKEAGNETLTLYPAGKEGAPARASGREVVLLLPSEALREIQGKLRGVREAKAVKE